MLVDNGSQRLRDFTEENFQRELYRNHKGYLAYNRPGP